MPAGRTYTPISHYKLFSDTSTVTFSNIPQGYTDLRLIISSRVASSSVDYLSIRFNGDTGSNYSFTWLGGNASGAQSARFSNLSQNIIGWATSNSENANLYAITNCDIMNYSNSTTHKTSISRIGLSDARSDIQTNLWRNTSPISSIVVATWGAGTFGANNLRAGSTFTLYGIVAA